MSKDKTTNGGYEPEAKLKKLPKAGPDGAHNIGFPERVYMNNLNWNELDRTFHGR